MKTKGTGWLMEQACTEMEERGLGQFSRISRHQLFVHEDVPYTSHNSSMCVEITACPSADELVRYMQRYLETRAAHGSDPGLCMISDTLSEDARQHLVHFGLAAKTTVLNKKLAYALAQQLSIHLTEHGGTGDGVVGALAGVGLRMMGNDGRYRGWHHLGPAGTVMQSGEITRLCTARMILDENGNPLADSVPVILQDRIKLIRRNSQPVLLTHPGTANEDRHLLSKDMLKKY